MAINVDNFYRIQEELKAYNATLVAVSKTKPVADLMALYELGQRHFGENYVQELSDKVPRMPADVQWHFIGHLQTNKVKYIAPFVNLIHGVDSLKLLKEIDKQARKINRTIDVLLQVFIAEEETKFGLSEEELATIMEERQLAALAHVNIRGLMGMASNTDDEDVISSQFSKLNQLFQHYQSLQRSNVQFTTLSMGMSGDYPLALAQGSNMVRIGSLLFGKRE